MDAIFTPARIQERAIELPAGLPEGAFVREMEISSTRLDSYFTHMLLSTLRNFAQEAGEGRAFLDSHDGSKLPMGYTFGGELAEEQGLSRALSNFYVVPGIRFGGRHSYASTDDYIRAVETRTARDVSVGFHGGKWICDICGGDYFSYSSCSHYGGIHYEIHHEGGESELVVCTIGIDDAHLSEVSSVFDGATPGAMIRKAQAGVRDGQLKGEALAFLEQRYRTPLLSTPNNWRGVDVPHKQTGDGTGRASDENPAANGRNSLGDSTMKTVELDVAAIRTALGVGHEGNPIETADEALQLLREAGQELNRLRPLADDGRAYRDDLVAQALAEGVRAQGEGFPQETYRALLADSSLDHIKQIRDQFAAQAAKQLPTGRQTTDEDETHEQPQSEPESVPAAAFRS